jgi:hypothetical protein
MNTTQPFTHTAAAPWSLGDQVAQIVPVTRAVFVAGPPVLAAWTGIVFFALMLAGPFALLVTFVVVLAAAAAVVALAGAILASPYLIGRQVHRRLAKRRELVNSSGATAAPVARTAWPIRQRAFAPLAD